LPQDDERDLLSSFRHSTTRQIDDVEGQGKHISVIYSDRLWSSQGRTFDR
jgi:hypothetical protein